MTGSTANSSVGTPTKTQTEVARDLLLFSANGIVKLSHSQIEKIAKVLRPDWIGLSGGDITQLVSELVEPTPANSSASAISTGSASSKNSEGSKKSVLSDADDDTEDFSTEGPSKKPQNDGDEAFPTADDDDEMGEDSEKSSDEQALTGLQDSTGTVPGIAVRKATAEATKDVTAEDTSNFTNPTNHVATDKVKDNETPQEEDMADEETEEATEEETTEKEATEEDMADEDNEEATEEEATEKEATEEEVAEEAAEEAAEEEAVDEEATEEEVAEEATEEATGEENNNNIAIVPNNNNNHHQQQAFLLQTGNYLTPQQQQVLRKKQSREKSLARTKKLYKFIQKPAGRLPKEQSQKYLVGEYVSARKRSYWGGGSPYNTITVDKTYGLLPLARKRARTSVQQELKFDDEVEEN